MKTLTKVIKSALLSLILQSSLYAQDILTFNDGRAINTVILEIDALTIKYKMHDHQDGPLRSALQKEVHKIVYENGIVGFFTQEPNAIKGKPLDSPGIPLHLRLVLLLSLMLPHLPLAQLVESLAQEFDRPPRDQDF